MKKHPVTNGDELSGILRYIIFNIKNRIVLEQTFDWIEGMKFYAKKGDAGIVGNIYYGLYEFVESIFLIHLLEKDDVFLDVGANVGHYSLLMSGIKKCRSIALEPVPKTFQQLVRQIELNKLSGKVYLINKGVSNKESELFFSTDRGTMDGVVNKEYKNAVRIPVSTIDNMLNASVPLAIKIDVEGYEKYALLGAQKTLENQNLKVIIVELNDSGRKYGVEDNEVYSELLKFGFKPFDYDFINRKLVSLNHYNKHKFNTIFVRDSNFVSARLVSSKKIKIRNKFF
ncbi:FkbM family methyltransferase [Flavobacterium adhaerens]|uniref:FkbM family methyltransferase n=1 Tax=Flavobacterium adhaerens TaxID=3149043 RepID=UPI0032B5F2E0